MCRDHIPVRDLYEDVSPGMYQVDYTTHTEWLQIYYDDGKGLRGRAFQKIWREGWKGGGEIVPEAGMEVLLI